jgi:mannosyl-3-phosphoglycerate phosphatase
VKRVVFTDLDGTLLDRFTYSYEKSLDAIELLKAKGVPIVFCSAKTAAEQKEYVKELGIADPFIVENGGAIYIPPGYFDFTVPDARTNSGYLVIELGTPYKTVRKVLKNIEGELGVQIKGFADMTAAEISQRTRLSPKFAALSKIREYDEPFYLDCGPEEVKQVLSKIEQAGLRWTIAGTHYSAIGNADKGKAVTILLDLLRRKFGEIHALGLGDTRNDSSMLSCMDMPVLVQQGPNQWADIDLPGLHKVDCIGPEGWTKVILELFAQ